MSLIKRAIQITQNPLSAVPSINNALDFVKRNPLATPKEKILGFKNKVQSMKDKYKNSGFYLINKNQKAMKKINFNEDLIFHNIFKRGMIIKNIMSIEEILKKNYRLTLSNTDYLEIKKMEDKIKTTKNIEELNFINNQIKDLMKKKGIFEKIKQVMLYKKDMLNIKVSIKNKNINLRKERDLFLNLKKNMKINSKIKQKFQQYLETKYKKKNIKGKEK